ASTGREQVLAIFASYGRGKAVACDAVPPFVKRRTPPAPGSIPDVLGMFHAEVRFYREIAPVVGVRMAAPGQVNGAEACPLTLVHGDAQARNMRTSPDGEVALLDWEDVSAAPGIVDLAWLLTASVDPGQWDAAIAAYGPASGLERVLPAIM